MRVLEQGKQQRLVEYLVDLQKSNDPILTEMEDVAKEKQFPIIGPECGRRLMTFALAVGASKVFEMGSGYGYSTLWFARAVGPGGEVVHTDGDPANTESAKQYLQRAEIIDRVRFLTGDAVALLEDDAGLYDVILIDIDKQDYPKALAAAVPKLRVGGFILAHNVIWHGAVADPSDTEKSTEGIREYNRRAYSHPELVSFTDPTDDGLGISLKVDAAVRSTLPI
jgi:predicted O-methyltransferase YrrM